MLAGESDDLPGVGSVVNQLLSPLLAPLRTALRPLGLPLRALGSTLGALLLTPNIVAFDTFVSLGTGTNQTRRREIRGRITVSTTRNIWCPDTDQSHGRDVLRQVADSEQQQQQPQF